MALIIDATLTPDQKAELATIPTASWFTQFGWHNGISPKHPVRRLDENNYYKQRLVADWIRRHVRGKRVLDLFSANGAFSIMAAQAGAAEVLGVEFDRGRVECARFVARTLRTDCKLAFSIGDVYDDLRELGEPFDVVLCLGGLYHVADPPYVLRQIRAVTRGHLILQTSNVWPLPGNFAQFRVRQDRAREGLTSIRSGEGTWHATPECVRQWLTHGGFRVLEERQPPFMKRRRFPWYVALCEPV